jgi:hypothetical protein
MEHFVIISELAALYLEHVPGDFVMNLHAIVLKQTLKGIMLIIFMNGLVLVCLHAGSQQIALLIALPEIKNAVAEIYIKIIVVGLEPLDIYFKIVMTDMGVFLCLAEMIDAVILIPPAMKKKQQLLAGVQQSGVVEPEFVQQEQKAHIVLRGKSV